MMPSNRKTLHNLKAAEAQWLITLDKARNELAELRAIVAKLPKCWRLNDPTCQCGRPMQPVEQPGLQPDWRCPACSEYVCSDLVRRELVQDVPVVPSDSAEYWVWEKPTTAWSPVLPATVRVLGISYTQRKWSIRVRDVTGSIWWIADADLASSRDAAEKLRERENQ